MDRFTEEGPGELARNVRISRERRDEDTGCTAAEMVPGFLAAHASLGLAAIKAVFAGQRAQRRTNGARLHCLEGGR